MPELPLEKAPISGFFSSPKLDRMDRVFMASGLYVLMHVSTVQTVFTERLLSTGV